MNKEKLISIIIPVYNVSKYLDRCMGCIVNQTYKNLEIILVDDGSKDDSGDKCDTWVKTDNRISVIHKQNGGLSSARNTGLDIARGEYIMFVDSDDVLALDIVENLYIKCIQNNSDISICEVKHVFGEEKVTYDEEDHCRVFEPEEAIIEMWYQKSFLPSAWGKLYKRELFKKIRFTENRLFEDIDIMHELFWESKKIVYSTARLYGYVHRENSITTSKFSKRDLDILIIAEKLIEFSKDKSVQMRKAAEAYATVAAFRVYLNAPDTKEFQEGINKAKDILLKFGNSVRQDKNIRKKHLYALYLYALCRPMMRWIYNKVDRWK